MTSGISHEPPITPCLAPLPCLSAVNGTGSLVLSRTVIVVRFALTLSRRDSREGGRGHGFLRSCGGGAWRHETAGSPQALAQG